MRVLWGTILASTAGTYAVILAPGVLEPPPRFRPPSFAGPFTVIALALAGASIVLPWVVHRELALKTRLTIVEEPILGAIPAGYRQAARGRRVFADRGAALREAARCYWTPLLIGIALSEAIAVLAIVFGVMERSPAVWMPFVVAGAALIAARFPTKARFEKPFEAALKATIPPPDEGGSRNS
jgi:hypothetical protein